MTALPTIGDINYPAAEEIRDGFLRTVKLDMARVGITVNVLPGSDLYARANAWSRRAVIAFANNRIRYEDLSPLTAKGDNLVTTAGIFGVEGRPASKSTGFVKMGSSGLVTIPANFGAIAPNGKTYVTVSNNPSIPSGSKVELASVDAGKATKQTAGTTLVWTSSAIGALTITCKVDVGGLDGGADADDEETLRRRLLDKLANPAGGGNAAMVRQLAEDATAAVFRAFVYQAVRGPATNDVAVVADGGDRTLSDATVAIVAGNLGTLPGHADDNVTSVVAEPVDVVLLGTLPLPTSAGGAGGGWADGNPWPSGTPVAGSNDGKVISYTAPTATVRTTSIPPVGGRIGVWDPVNQAMNEYTIATSGGVSGAYTITVQGLDGSVGFKASPLNCYVSAGASNLSLYAATFLAQMNTLGPGEKSESPEVLPRGQRQPVVSGTDPRDLDNRLIGALMAAHPELEASYGLRLDAGSGSPRTSPSVPANAISPPRILTLNNFSIWKA